jgi:hypothetical protein
VTARRLVIAVFLCVASLARAQTPPDPEAVEAAKKHFAAGQKLFDAGDLSGAAGELKEAYRLTRNPLLLYNIAVVYDRLGDAALALHYFTRFIDDQKDTERSHERLLEAGKRAAELRRTVGAEEPPQGQPATEPPLPAAEPVLVHEPIDQAPPGRPLDVTAGAPRDRSWSVLLSYRAAGEDLYQQVKMRPLPGLGAELVGRIPASAMKGTALQYFLTARDGEGKVIASSGRATTPNVIVIDPAAPVHAYLQPGDEPTGAALPIPARAADTPPRPATFYAKWAASGGAAVLLGVGIGLTVAARSYAETLEAQAVKSVNDTCAPFQPPCHVFSTADKDLESTGKSYQRWGQITLVAGAAIAGAAGVLWYLDSREHAAPPPPRRTTATPIVGPGTVGAAASVPF